MGGCFSQRSAFVDPFDKDCNTNDSSPSNSNESAQANKLAEEEFGTSNAFMQFDCISDYSDHHFRNRTPDANPASCWVKRIHNEWKVLQKDLPEYVFVRVYQDRMDLLRAAIVGLAETPYHDGLFFFDVRFPPNYPHSPPEVYYHSGGLRLNPNLYANGLVCLSLLNTWFGKTDEKWNPSSSTMLQVLVSIQGLVLNANPYFNEPVYSRQANTVKGKIRSLNYNKDVFLLSCRTMIYSIKNPPKHFEELVMGHFHKYGCSILEACRAYIAGACVGSSLNTTPAQSGRKNESFPEKLRKLYPILLQQFCKAGIDCSHLKLTNKDTITV